MHISEIVFKRKTLFYFLLFSIVIGGVLSYIKISKLEDPEVKVKSATVVTIYPGASSHEVELNVTEVIEEELQSLADIDEIKSTSNPNVSIIEVKLKWTVPEKEVEQRWDKLRRKVELAKPKLPKNALAPTIYDDISDVYGMFYALTADGYSYEEMNKYAEYIKRSFLEIEGVSKVKIYGNQKLCVNIELLDEKMANLGIFPIQIISAINSQNEDVYPGSFESANQTLRLAVDGKFKNIDDIKNLIIQDLEGKQILLSDIAKISRSYQDPIRNNMTLNNEKALGISISMESGENIIDIGKRVENKLDNIQGNIPAGIKLDKVFFQPDRVSNSINSFMKNLIISIFIVVVVLMITMGIRSGLIIGSGLLFTILATFPILLIADGTLQRISLGAFIVAMGMLVDNAIVVIDGIMVDLQNGVPRKFAMTNSAKKTALPLLGATIIGACAFLPAYLSPDSAGVYIRDLFLVICISLLISWILAITHVPIFSNSFLKLKNKNNNKKPYQGKVFIIVKRILEYCLKYRKITITITIIVMAIAAYSFKYVKKTFFPDFNYNQVYIEYILPDGSGPNLVNKDLKKITEYFLSFDETKMVVTSHGMTPTRYCLVRAMGETSDNYGELIVNFKDYETMIKMKPIFEKYLRENYPNAYTRIRKYNLSITSSHAVEVQFSGPDPAVLRNLSQQAQNIMHKSPQIDHYTICEDWQPLGKSLCAKYAQSAAKRLGTNRSDISNALLATTCGLPIGTYYEGENSLDILLKTRNSEGNKIQDLSNIPVWNMIPSLSSIDKNSIYGLMNASVSKQDILKNFVSSVPLEQVTNGIELKWEESGIRRINGQRTIQAQCDPKENISPAAARESIIDEIEKIKLPAAYSMKWVGEYDLQSKGTKNIYSFFPLVFIIAFLILILLFNDIKKPIIVVICLPLAFIGIVPALILSGNPFTFLAIVGLIGLIGMLIKNIIVLLDEIEKQIKSGKNKYSAVVDSTITRVRPVIMASFTTILGMLPLIFDPMYKSMAITIMSGLLIGTLITLIFVPLLYSVFFNIKYNEVKKLTI